MTQIFLEKKKLALFVSALLLMCGVGVFAYAMQHGGRLEVKLKMQQLANLISTNPQLITIRPLVDDTPVCATGALPGANAILYVSAPDKVRLYISRSDGSVVDGIRLNETMFFPNGAYRIEVKILDGAFILDPQSIKQFEVRALCDASQQNSSLTTQTPNQNIYTASSSLSTSSTTATTTSSGLDPNIFIGTSSTTPASTTPQTTSSTTVNTSTTTTVTKPVSTLDTAFNPRQTYPQNWNIIPSLYKDNVRVFSALGTVSVRVEIPVDRVYILVGNRSEWFSDGVIDASRGLTRVQGTNRYTYAFDSTQYADGEYRIGAVYFDPYKGWMYSGNVDFVIKNTIITNTLIPAPTSQIQTNSSGAVAIEPVSVSVASTTQPAVQIVQKTEYAPTWTQTTIAPAFSPTLRLVVNDRAITALAHTFDREELEMRATTLPAISVQFFAYSLDGAFSPAIKEIGKGGKDDILSRDDKEVWAYTVDMGTFPAGNYRLFARVKTLDGKIQETQPVSVVVQHLNQISGAVEQREDTPLVVSEATREDILKRIHDPSACQNRQECQVFCSSSASATTKCVEYTRVKGIDGLFTAVEGQVKILQAEAQKISEIATSSSQAAPEMLYPEFAGRPSIVDVMPTSVLADVVARRVETTAILPEEVNTVVKLQHYCGSIENEKECTTLTTAHTPELESVVHKQIELVRDAEIKLTSILEQRSGARAYIDSDGDSVSDFDEVNLYHSDPTKKDTNGDGYSDGAAILGQTSVLSEGEAFEDDQGKIVLGRGVSVENPKIAGTTQSAKFTVTSVVPLEIEKKEGVPSEIKKIVFKGTALPNSFVKVFLFSEPVVVTVKADDMGNWTYILDKTLPDGTHTAYVALADGAGRVLAKSEPLPFVKEASAIAVAGEQIARSDDVFQKKFMGMTPMTLMALLVGVLGLALSVVGVVVGVRHKHGADGSPEQPTSYGS